MAGGINRTITSSVYGLTNALQDIAQAPIVAGRNPTVNDYAQNGTLWSNKSSNALYACTGVAGGKGEWSGIANAPLSVSGTPVTSPTLATTVGIYSGSGAPSFAAAKGSLYLRIDGSSSATRAYICSAASGSWEAVTTAG